MTLLAVGDCFEPLEPEFDYYECAAVSVGGRHSESYGDDGQWVCQWCGARPQCAVTCCDASCEYDFRVDPRRWRHDCRLGVFDEYCFRPDESECAWVESMPKCQR